VIPDPGPHGGDAPAIAAALGLDLDTVLDLSMSLNPVAPDPVPVLARGVDAVHRYPDPEQATAALAEAVGVDPDRLLLTNGGAEAIALVAAEVGGHVQEPEFGLHPRGDSGPLWRSNPHNPTGALAGVQEHADVWDEAFYPLATGQWTRGDGEAIVVGSLTKLLACPGLRIGYVLADPDRIARFRRWQPVWSVNGIACRALPALLKTVDLPAWSGGVAALRAELVSLLRRHGLDPWPSAANWVLVPDPRLRERLAPYGVVVRDCTSFGLDGVVRIAVPGPAGLARLDDTLSRLAAAGSV
jgi:histidinol-phosphate/aromatic aminotransferase/cobyric acid decarboxylase-like protein